MRNRLGRTARIAIYCWSWHGLAHAQTTDAEEQSTVLFYEGKELLAKGDVARACERFEQSYRLLQRGGTLLNLALCHEREGRLGAAFRELSEALAVAKNDRRDDRIAVATEHLAALERRFSWLRIVPPPNVEAGRVSAMLDGVPLDRETWDAVPIETGKHLLVVAAEGFQERTIDVVVETAGERRTERVAELVAKPNGDSDAKAVAPPASSAASVAPASRVSEAQSGSTAAVRKAGFIATGVGMVGIGLGAYFGLRAIGNKNDARNDGCDRDGGCTTTSGYESWRAAQDAGTASTVCVLAGSAALAGGIVMLLYGNTNSDRAERVRAVPAVGARDFGLILKGGF